MLLLGLSFGRLGLLLCRLELTHRHKYLFDDEGIRYPKQGAWQVGHWSLWCVRLLCNDWFSHYTQDIIFDLFGYGYDGIPGSH